MTKRRQQIINAYRKNKNLRECGKLLGISFQRVHQVIRDYAPELMRPAHLHYDRPINRAKAGELV